MLVRKCYKPAAGQQAYRLMYILDGRMIKPATIAYYRAVANRVQQYVANHLQEDVSLQRVADHAFVSYHHLAAIYEQAEQESIGGYIKRVRLEKAASLLWYTSLSLSAIAEKTGYAGSPSLSKAFDQQFHCSPGAFRKRPQFLKHSPNALLDGVHSAEAYQVILEKDFDFEYRIETLHDYYTVCQSLKMVQVYFSRQFQYEDYLDIVFNDMDPHIHGAAVIKPFDSLNFSPANRFSMHHGKLITGEALAQLPPSILEDYIVSPVMNGKYLVFDIPTGPVNEQISNYTTLFRENLVGYKKIFHPEDFFIFLLLNENGHRNGEFYLYLSP